MPTKLEKNYMKNVIHNHRLFKTTYGEIICTIHKVGLNLCNDLRMSYQLEKDQKYARK